MDCLRARPPTHRYLCSASKTQKCNPRVVLPSQTRCRAHGEGPGAWAQLQTGFFATCASAVLLASQPAVAADTAEVGACLLQKCQLELARCLGDVQCVENLVCLNTCNGRPDESECQIKCGDKYEDNAVNVFNTCAVSDKKCVKQRVDIGVYPAPPDSALDTTFDPSQFTGRWYITAGYNDLFDTFPCQEHYFVNPEPGKLFGRINWRIPLDNGDFIERSTVQRFLQDPENPAKLYNHDNAYLHYEDDWYVSGWKDDTYAFIYYKGQNDAWAGYGGATVYTREPQLPLEYVPEFREAAAKVGLDWDKFKVTDNSCPPKPEGLLEGIEKALGETEIVSSFGRGFTTLESAIQNELTSEQRTVSREIAMASRQLKEAEAAYNSRGGIVGAASRFIKGLFGGA